MQAWNTLRNIATASVAPGKCKMKYRPSFAGATKKRPQRAFLCADVAVRFSESHTRREIR